MSGNISNKKIKNAYADMLHIDNSNAGISTTLKQVKTGNGNAICDPGTA